MAVHIHTAETRAWILKLGIDASELVYHRGEPYLWCVCTACEPEPEPDPYAPACSRCGGGRKMLVRLDWLIDPEFSKARAAEARRMARADKRTIRRRDSARARAFLAEFPGLARDLRTQDKICKQSARDLISSGRLTRKQIRLIRKIGRQARAKAAENAERIAIRKAEGLPVRNFQAIPEGRQTIVGKIISMRAEDAYYGHRRVVKMLVEDDCGFRVWGSKPRAISGADRGDRVRFTATIERKDSRFGFFSYPNKAEVIESARLSAGSNLTLWSVAADGTESASPIIRRPRDRSASA